MLAITRPLIVNDTWGSHPPTTGNGRQDTELRVLLTDSMHIIASTCTQNTRVTVCSWVEIQTQAGQLSGESSYLEAILPANNGPPRVDRTDSIYLWRALVGKRH